MGPTETLFLTSTLTQPVCLPLTRSLMEQHVSPLDGARTSLELLDSTRWFSRRLIFLWSTMESVKTSSEPPDLDKSTSSTTPSCALEESPARTPARETEAAHLSAPQSMIPTPMSRLVSLPGALVVESKAPLESTLLASSARSSITSSTSTVNAVFNGNRVLLPL